MRPGARSALASQQALKPRVRREILDPIEDDQIERDMGMPAQTLRRIRDLRVDAGGLLEPVATKAVTDPWYPTLGRTSAKTSFRSRSRLKQACIREPPATADDPKSRARNAARSSKNTLKPGLHGRQGLEAR